MAPRRRSFPLMSWRHREEAARRSLGQMAAALQVCPGRGDARSPCSFSAEAGGCTPSPGLMRRFPCVSVRAGVPGASLESQTLRPLPAEWRKQSRGPPSPPFSCRAGTPFRGYLDPASLCAPVCSPKQCPVCFPHGGVSRGTGPGGRGSHLSHSRHSAKAQPLPETQGTAARAGGPVTLPTLPGGGGLGESHPQLRRT